MFQKIILNIVLFSGGVSTLGVSLSELSGASVSGSLQDVANDTSIVAARRSAMIFLNNLIFLFPFIQSHRNIGRPYVIIISYNTTKVNNNIFAVSSQILL